MHGGGIAPVDGDEHLLDGEPRRRVDPPHRTEVEQPDPSVVEQQHVARMRVGVEDAVPEDLVQHGAQRGAGQRVPVPPFSSATFPARSSVTPSSHSCTRRRDEVNA